MRDRARARICLLPLVSSLAAGCAHGQSDPPLLGLSVSISDLQLHLRDDPYRSFNQLDGDGQNVFAVARWKIERFQRERGLLPDGWQLEDYVLELAHARTLERLHLYRQAIDAYERVAQGPAPMAAPARSSAQTLQRFAALARPLPADASPDEILAEIDRRIAAWTEAAEQMTDPGYASLAREEVEGWERLRVHFLARERGLGDAIDAYEQLVRHHAESKLHPRHLIELGDLHAEEVRDIVLWARAQQEALEGTAFESHFDSALAAYELASEAPLPMFREEAQSRIQALLAYHDGVMNGVY